SSPPASRGARAWRARDPRSILAAMDQRPVGQSPLRVSALGLGCMSLSGVYGAADDAASVTLVQHALDRGITHIDSSDMYGWAHNETLLGRALRGRRHRAVLATKFGQTRNPSGANLVNGRPEYVRDACDASLARLGVDVIDLYYQHRVDPSVPIEDTVGAMKGLVEAGKGGAPGLSEAAPAPIRPPPAVHPPAPAQT